MRCFPASGFLRLYVHDPFRYEDTLLSNSSAWFSHFGCGKRYISVAPAVKLMSSSLVTVFLPSRRTDLFLFLKEKPGTVEEINSELGIGPDAILSRLKRLEENGLVVQQGNIYSLSLTGKILVRRMESLVKAFRLLEDDYDYCPGVKPGGIPPVFFKLMEELIVCFPALCHGDDVSSMYREVTEAFCSSKQLLLIISCPHMSYSGICAEHAKKGLKVSVILTRLIFEKLTEEFKEDLDALLLLENSEMYILGNDFNPPTVAVTDTMVLTCFSSEKMDDSEDNSMVVFGDKAVQWGKELFEHFRVLAEPLGPDPSKQLYLEASRGESSEDKSLSKRTYPA
ncbi:Transcriptional regulator, ArsR family [Methanosarcina siciliae HI350]|uniref:Transcriptional regulator, ArsR family n=2 Tax=Methanosarcina siciliae TaxID=38027 RepID=A0A0E3LAG7_9EURY|nr:Transcriptional regulator, ArsR family [Methanosarcina siciliae HI350]